jgi:hypothetical protein
LASEIGMVLSKGFPLKDAFDLEVSHLIESGILSLWERQVVKDSPELLMRRRNGDASLTSQPIALGMAHLGGPFCMLMLGLFFAFITFLMEIVICIQKLKIDY